MWTLAKVPSSVGLPVEQLGPAQLGRAQGGPSPGRCLAGRKEAKQGRLWALTPPIPTRPTLFYHMRFLGGKNVSLLKSTETHLKTTRKDDHTPVEIIIVNTF